MAVAVKNASETSAPSLMDRLAARSLLGVLYVLASISLVLYVLPAVWMSTVGQTLGQTSPVVNGALLLLDAFTNTRLFVPLKLSACP